MLPGSRCSALNAVVKVAVKMDMMTMPMMIHRKPNTRAGPDAGVLSP